MTNKAAASMAKWLIDNGCKEEKREIYQYGIECILNTVITFGIIFLYAIFTQELKIAICWFLFFLPLRHTAGGIHAHTRLVCFGISLVVGIGSIIVNKYIPYENIFGFACMLFSVIIIFIAAPVIHPNHPVSEQRKNKIKIVARWMVIIESGCLIILMLLQKKDLLIGAGLGLFFASASTFLGFIKYSNFFRKK